MDPCIGNSLQLEGPQMEGVDSPVHWCIPFLHPRPSLCTTEKNKTTLLPFYSHRPPSPSWCLTTPVLEPPEIVYMNVVFFDIMAASQLRLSVSCDTELLLKHDVKGLFPLAIMRQFEGGSQADVPSTSRSRSKSEK